MDFVKMEGLGNDFVVVDGPIELSPDDIQHLCDRRRGIGADGVLEVTSLTDGTAVRMRYWNADGSAAEMCGNGLRCVARYAFDSGLVTESSFIVETQVGRNGADVRADGTVRVQLGTFGVGDELHIDGRSFHCASVGNPHAVTFVDAASTELVRSVGPAVEHDQHFPDGTNVEFVTVRGDALEMRVWERGVGETQACGTGAAAVAAVAHSLGASGTTTSVDLLGGRLEVELIGDQAWITGPATYVFSGSLSRAGDGSAVPAS
jgi:diaminopimelate epimerase